MMLTKLMMILIEVNMLLVRLRVELMFSGEQRMQLPNFTSCRRNSNGGIITAPASECFSGSLFSHEKCAFEYNAWGSILTASLH